MYGERKKATNNKQSFFDFQKPGPSAWNNLHELTIILVTDRATIEMVCCILI